MVDLYPNSSVLPYHHMILHFSRFLRGFGPVQSWRCYPFERFNYMLQQIKTNKKFGKI